MMKNFISINGKQTELTKEQLKQLGIDVEPEKCKTPFDRVDKGETYWAITPSCLHEFTEYNRSLSDVIFNSNAYFNDKYFTQQVLLHELLNRKLMKFTYENGWSEDLWGNGDAKHYIYFDTEEKVYDSSELHFFKLNCVYFISSNIAKLAINEIILPFQEEHPEFKW